MNGQVEKLFNMICHLNEGVDAPFEMKVKGETQTYENLEVQQFVQKKIHEFGMSAYSVVEGKPVAIQAFTGSSDLDKIETNVWNAFQEDPNSDMFWQEAFRAVPLRKGQLEWSIATVNSGTGYKLLSEGEKIEYQKYTGTKTTVEVELYGGGLEVSWRTIEGRDLAGFYNSMVDFRAKRGKLWADAHYGLLAAAALNEQIAWVAGTSTLERDILTLNEGYNTIGEECKDSGFGDTANARMILYVSPRLRQRINQALRVTSADMARAGGAGQITMDSNIEVRYTYNDAIPANKGLLVLPGNKIQNSVYMNEKNFERINPDNLNWLKSSFTAFGAGVGENAQTAELAFA